MNISSTGTSTIQTSYPTMAAQQSTDRSQAHNYSGDVTTFTDPLYSMPTAALDTASLSRNFPVQELDQRRSKDYPGIKFLHETTTNKQAKGLRQLHQPPSLPGLCSPRFSTYLARTFLELLIRLS